MLPKPRRPIVTVASASASFVAVLALAWTLAAPTAGLRSASTPPPGSPAASGTATVPPRIARASRAPSASPSTAQPAGTGTRATTGPAKVAVGAATSRPPVAPTTAPRPATAPPPVVLPPAGHGYLLITAGELAARPMSGKAWSNLLAVADAPVGTPDIANQDDDTDQHAFAKALVFARTGQRSYRDQTLALLKAAVGTEAGGPTLALGRNLTGYVFAADLIQLAAFDPGWDGSVFRPWLRRVLTEPMTEGGTLIETAETRPSNWGTYAGASWAAVAAYLRDASQLATAATVFRGWLGDWSAYHGFKFEAVASSWAPDPAHIGGIDAPGSSIGGHSVDGVLPSDMSRGGSFAWPPGETGYVWEGLAGAYEEAEILARRGYPTYTWSNQALRRAVAFLWGLNAQFGYWFDISGPPLNANSWIPWLVNARYRTSYPAKTTRVGRGMGFTDWLYGG